MLLLTQELQLKQAESFLASDESCRFIPRVAMAVLNFETIAFDLLQQ